MSPRVRVACPADLAAVLLLVSATPGLPRWSDDSYQRALQDQAGAPLQRLTFVAEADARVVGFAVLSILQSVAPAECELEVIAVDPVHQKRGLGRALLLAVIAAAREQGAVHCRLEVRAGNANAIAFYLQQGFMQTGTRLRYYDSPVEDATLMEATLVPSGTDPVARSGIIRNTYGA